MLLTLQPLATAMPRQESAPGVQEPAKKATPADDIFSGTVTALTDDSVTVVRKVPARDAVTQKFARDAQTKVEGRLKLKARVSVRYETAEDGQLRAVHIIVR